VSPRARRAKQSRAERRLAQQLPQAEVSSRGPSRLESASVAATTMIPLLGITLILYAAVAVSALAGAGATVVAAAAAPLAAAVEAGRLAGLSPIVRFGATVASADIRSAIGFSSFAVLTYYAIANAAAPTFDRSERRWPRSLAAAGLRGCVVLALTVLRASLVCELESATRGGASERAPARWCGCRACMCSSSTGRPWPCYVGKPCRIEPLGQRIAGETGPAVSLATRGKWSQSPLISGLR
jgi:hypothetical protein